MTDKHEVTVYDRVPATARVSAAQVEDFLYRTGWNHKDSLVFAVCGSGLDPLTAWAHPKDGRGDPIYTSRQMSACDIAVVIECVAMSLDRQPSAVLADIAKEPT
jgi:hypothetical protein